jgi:2-phosphosulfolactate phosphatase
MDASKLEVLFTPAEFAGLRRRDLSETACVVIDVLRATSSMAMALSHGARAIIPVEEISEAMSLRRQAPEILLAGERDGLRISAEISGGMAFDLGNSPREFTADLVQGKTIAMTTTNGTRALRASAPAQAVVIASFLNLSAATKQVRSLGARHVLLVCGGTYAEAGYEDVLCAGAMIDQLATENANELADSALLARKLYRLERADLVAALAQSRNGRRLLSRPDLRDDVAFCAQIDFSEIGACLERDGCVRQVDSVSG